MSPQMSRLLQILVMLPRAPRFMTTESIVHELENQRIEVNLRTVQRDLQTLQDAFGNKIGSENPPDTTYTYVDWTDKFTRYFWAKDAPVFKLAGLTVNQALTLKLLEAHLKPLFPDSTLNELDPFFAEAEATLNNLEDNAIKAWPNKVAIYQPLSPVIPIHIVVDVKEKIMNSLLADRQIEVLYNHVNGEMNRFVANPLGLLMRGSVLYLVVFRDDIDAYQTLALHRIAEVVEQNKSSIKPSDFTLNNFIKNKSGFETDNETALIMGKSWPVLRNYIGREIEVELVFDEKKVTYILESPISINQKNQPYSEGYVLITGKIKYTLEFFHWLVSLGSDVEVLKPEFLRTRMIVHVERILSLYNKNL